MIKETIKTTPSNLVKDITQKIYELVLEAKEDYNFKKFVINILRSNNALKLDDKDKAQVLLYWFQENIRPHYVNDSFRVETIKSPLIMLKEYLEGDVPSGDCDDFVTFYTAMLESIGIKTTLIFPSYIPHRDKNSSSSVPNHVAVMFEDRKTGKWFVADPTSPLPIMDIDSYEKRVGPVIYIIERELPSGEIIKPKL